MNIWALLGLAIALGTDSFSVCLGIGTTRIAAKKIFFMSAVIGVFHIFMPLLGIWLGNILGKVAGDMASIIGALILIFLGAKMIYDNLYGSSEEEIGFNYTSLSGILLLALSVSLDALSIGFSLGTLGAAFIAVFIFGAAAFLMSAAGLLLGRKIGIIIGKRAELLGGIILLGLGVMSIL